jgi:uncharacterized membrane protein YhhN
VTALAAVLLFATASSAVLDWIAVARRPRAARLEYVAKPATLAFLTGVALTIDPADDAQRAWFVVALCFSLVGDVFLMLPGDAFVAGLASFLLGHLAYVVGFAQLDPAVPSLAVAAIVVALVAIPLAGRLARGARSSGQQRVVVPVLAYVAVIGLMVTFALATGNVVAAAGALLFMASDALIGWTRFVSALRGAPLAIIVTYHLGQVLLVLSLPA